MPSTSILPRAWIPSSLVSNSRYALCAASRVNFVTRSEDLQRLVVIRGIAQPVCGKDVCANEAHELLVMRVCNPMA